MPESHSRPTPKGPLLGLVALLLLAMAAGTIAQFAIPVLGPLIIEDLGLTRTQFGAIMAGYFLATAVFSPKAGSVTDHIQHRHTIAACFAFGGLSLIAVGVAPGMAAFGVAAILGALGSAVCNPGTNRVVLARVDLRARGMVVGAKQSGVQVAAVSCGLLLPPLSALIGWRLAAATFGVVLLAVAVLSEQLELGRPEEVTGGPAPARPRLRSHPDLLALCGFAGLMGAATACVATYMPTFAVEEAGWSVARAGALVATIGATGIAARLLWGWVAGRSDTPLWILPWLSIVATAGSTFLVAALGDPRLLWAAVVVLGASGAGWHGVAMLGAMTITGPAHAGWATGRVMLAFYAGLGVSPIPFGWLVDTTDSYRLAWTLVVATFAASFVSIMLPRWLRPNGPLRARASGSTT